MTPVESAHLAIVRDYLTALEAGATGTTLARFFTPDALQIEHPNRLNPSGGRSDLPTLLARAERASSVIRDQKYDLQTAVSQGERAAVECLWSGVLAMPAGTLTAGSTLRARIAMFFEFRDSLICRQNNYDCFEPF